MSVATPKGKAEERNRQPAAVIQSRSAEFYSPSAARLSMLRHEARVAAPPAA
jgi:hypothetical protein